VNVEHEMYDYTGNNLSHQHSNKRFQETFGSHARKSFSTVTTKDSYTWNITHSTECTSVWNLKTGWWGSPLVQGEK